MLYIPILYLYSIQKYETGYPKYNLMSSSNRDVVRSFIDAFSRAVTPTHKAPYASIMLAPYFSYSQPMKDTYLRCLLSCDYSQPLADIFNGFAIVYNLQIKYNGTTYGKGDLVLDLAADPTPASATFAHHCIEYAKLSADSTERNCVAIQRHVDAMKSMPCTSEDIQALIDYAINATDSVKMILEAEIIARAPPASVAVAVPTTTTVPTSTTIVSDCPIFGAANKGNSCFFNTMLATLGAVPDIVAKLQAAAIANPTTASFLNALAQYFIDHNIHKVYAAGKECPKIAKFFNGNQQDPMELYMLANIKFTLCEIQYNNKCSNCNAQTSTSDRLASLPSISTAPQSIPDYHCYKCSQTNTTSRTTVYDPSEYVILRVDNPASNVQINDSTYRCIATMNHSGGPTGGHWFANRLRNGTWYTVNDDSVTIATGISKLAYYALYRRT